MQRINGYPMCETCQGDGRVDCELAPRSWDIDQRYERVECEGCDGRGWLEELTCLNCDEEYDAGTAEECCSRGPKLCPHCTWEHDAGCPNHRPHPDDVVHPIFADLLRGLRPKGAR